MTKGDRFDKGRLITTESDKPDRNGDMVYRRVRHIKGAVRFTKSYFFFNDELSEKRKALVEELGPAENRWSFEWQDFSELQVDYGLGEIFSVLEQAGFGWKPAGRNILAEIQEKTAAKDWSLIEAKLSTFGAYEDADERREIFLVAVWAELHAERFEEVWLAAMAQYAYFVKNDQFAFGYLVALLDQKRENERHLLRGKNTVESARLGGEARSKGLQPRTDRVLREIEKLVQSGQTIAQSARIAAKRGHGKSAEANIRLWRRHLKK